jgi:hypothetical protein
MADFATTQKIKIFMDYDFFTRSNLLSEFMSDWEVVHSVLDKWEEEGLHMNVVKKARVSMKKFRKVYLGLLEYYLDMLNIFFINEEINENKFLG